MRFVLYTNALSEHQMPLAREIVKRIGEENFRYVYTGVSSQKFQESSATDEWIVRAESHPWLEEADVMLVGGIRPIKLIERRLAKGLITCYMSERWFKPIGIGVEKRCRCRAEFPGFLRLLVPRYRWMAKRFVKLFDLPAYRFLPIGPWSKFDMLRMCRWFGQKVDAGQIIDWGDFVAPSVTKELKCEVEVEQRKSSSSLQLGLGTSTRTLKVLWVGRDLAWKRVRDIERAVALANKKLISALHLHLESTPITFTKLTGVTMSEVRAAMRSHDVYVLASDATEGWGCVVNEALEEGMNVIGTFEAGASAAILPKNRLYHAGDVKALAKLLIKEYNGELSDCEIGEWTAKVAAVRLLKEVGFTCIMG